MNDYYCLETYNKTKHKLTIWLILMISILVFGLAFTGFSAFLVKANNATLITVIDAIILSICVCFFLYFLVEKYIPNHRRNKFLYNVLIVSRYEGLIEIKKIKKPYLVKKYIEAYEIEAVDDTNKIFICYLETVFPISFKVGDKINVLLANNFIVDISENSDEQSH